MAVAGEWEMKASPYEAAGVRAAIRPGTGELAPPKQFPSSLLIHQGTTPCETGLHRPLPDIHDGSPPKTLTLNIETAIFIETWANCHPSTWRLLVYSTLVSPCLTWLLRDHNRFSAVEEQSKALHSATNMIASISVITRTHTNISAFFAVATFAMADIGARKRESRLNETGSWDLVKYHELIKIIRP
jgi:hypothetical protein